MIKRAAFPSILVLIFSLIPFLALWPTSGSWNFETHLSAIENQAPFETHYQQALDYIQFMANVKNVEQDSEAAQQLANFHFRMGQAILHRGEKQRFGKAITSYQKAVDLYPPLGHGWPFFQIAAIYENLQQFEKAKHFYKEVANYDFGDLALRAGYRQCRVQQRLGLPISSILLYDYLRYSHVGKLDDLKLFQDVELYAGSSSPHILDYLQALFSYNKGESSLALERMKRYRTKEPSDYSSLYYLNRIRERFTGTLFPPSGNLLLDPHTPLALRNGSIRLLEKGELLADFYTGPGGANQLFELLVQCGNAKELQGTLHIRINESSYAQSLAGESLKFTLPVHAKPGKNVVSLFFIMSSKNTSPWQNWIHIQTLSLKPVEKRGAS